ncbi:MAG: hypothetical protein A3K65_08590 [Euryarchaeota archaeon RBG_16_68_12]|nr:MAG: hypothetical protein A3K65_08590 [Euryarchaeota archaeon RBG_16_68_12]
MAAIEVTDLTYAYPDGTGALEHLDLRVEEGEKVAIVGGNGAGKSTLLELLCGFHFPFQGAVRIQGELLTRESAARVRRHFGLVFQDPDDQVFMPRVWDDVAFGPTNLGWTPERVRNAVEEALVELRIHDLRDRAPHRLSFGQRKRVAIAGVLAMNPEVLLLDEPMSGLDHEARSELLSLLSASRKTHLITTHNLEGIVEFMDRVVVLKVTKVAEGGPREILLRDDIMAAANVDVPPISRLFRALQKRGHPMETLPLSIEEAIRVLTGELAKAEVPRPARPARP